MKTVIRIAAFLVATLGFAADAIAQDVPHDRPEGGAALAAAVDARPDGRDSRGVSGAFEKMPPAERARAEAVFYGQSVTALGSAPMNLDQIATLHERGGWDLVFTRMKARGLTRAKTVRQMLAGARKRRPAARMDTPRLTVVTNGAGERIIIFRNAPSPRGGSN